MEEFLRLQILLPHLAPMFTQAAQRRQPGYLSATCYLPGTHTSFTILQFHYLSASSPSDHHLLPAAAARWTLPRWPTAVWKKQAFAHKLIAKKETLVNTEPWRQTSKRKALPGFLTNQVIPRSSPRTRSRSRPKNCSRWRPEGLTATLSYQCMRYSKPKRYTNQG